MVLEHIEFAKIEYQCNMCLNIRIMLIPRSALIFKGEGYIEIYDLHKCLNNKMVPTLLFVDANLDVRAQSQFQPKDNKEEIISDIPIPKKPEMTKVEIKLPDNIKLNLIRGITIIDKLRELQYELKSENKQKVVEVESQYRNIKIIADVFVGLEEENTIAWLKSFANELELVTIFRPEILSYAISYFNENLTERCTALKLIEIDLLVNAMTVFLETSEKEVELYKSGWRQEFTAFTKEQAETGKEIMSIIAEEKVISILDLMERVMKKTKNTMNVSEFLKIVSELITKELITTYRAEFVTLLRYNKKE